MKATFYKKSGKLRSKDIYLISKDLDIIPPVGSTIFFNGFPLKVFDIILDIDTTIPEYIIYLKSC